ncbi:MAG TPA: hypothetical protein VFI84_02245, partial [Candidatus Saccharimonadales bacterium]|nr:hypothetical protein [Candidatus Saccharimonadales bacterium]
PTMVYAADHGFINHPDHRAAGQATLDAVFPMARDHLTFPELYAEGHQPHKTATVLLVNFENPNYFSDITDTLETKFAIMSAHQSQDFGSKETLAKAESLMAKMGSKCGYRYAESFVRIDIDLT